VYTFFFLALKGGNIPAQGNALGKYIKSYKPCKGVTFLECVLFNLSLCCALTGLKYWLIFTQGVALGCYVAALSGLRKKMYTLVDLSVLNLI
jgi:hypothetical protein